MSSSEIPAEQSVNELNDIKSEQKGNAWDRIFGYGSFGPLFVMSILFSLPLIIYVFKDDGITSTADTASLLDKFPILLMLALTFAGEISAILLSMFLNGGFKRWAGRLYLKNFKWKNILLGVGVGVGLFVGLLVIDAIGKLAGIAPTNSDTANLVASGSGISKFLSLFLFVSFLAPFAEELFFRGHTMGLILRGHGVEGVKKISGKVLVAIIFQGVLFGLLHFQGLGSFMDIFVLVYTISFGIIAGALVVKTQSLYTSFAAHAAYNLLSAIGLYLAIS